MKIEIKKANDNIIKGCMCLEGGAFRGVYTAGVLDCLMEHGINLETTIGVSAGALNAVNYVSGDIGRSADLSILHRNDADYISFKHLALTGNVVNFDYVFDTYAKQVPLDEERLFKGDRKIYVVATNIKTGKPEYFDNSDKETLYKAVIASASMPLVSRSVKINGNRYLDGGCSTKLPIRWALKNGFEKIVFIATRDASYRRNPIPKEFELEKIRYARFPNFVDALEKANTLYNNDCDLIDELVKQGKIFRIAPSEKVTISRLEGDENNLFNLYELGYYDALFNLPDLFDYLEIE